MKPILFNTEMVRAILEGRKTVTRRVVKIPPYTTFMYPRTELEVICGCGDSETVVKAPYKVGDVLYVRETWIDWSCAECDCECVGDNGYGHCDMPKYLYKASHEETYKGWKPSIHMPKAAARIFLKVSSVRVERLQDMTVEDCHKEGVNIATSSITDGETLKRDHDFSLEKFETLWDSTIKPDQLKYYGWEANPYVWVIEFERIEKPEAAV